MRKMLLTVVMVLLYCLSIVFAAFLYSAGDYFYVFVGLICCAFYGICTVKAIKKRDKLIVLFVGLERASYFWKI